MPIPNPTPRLDQQPSELAADPTSPPSRGRGRRVRPGPPAFTFEVQLLGGEAGRQLEQEQTEAIIEVLAWLAAHPPPPTTATRSAAATTSGPARTTTGMSTGTGPASAPGPAGLTTASTGTRTGTSRSGDAPTPRPDSQGLPGRSSSPDGRTRGSWSYPAAVRVQAVGLVGVGQPPGEVARALDVHPAALRRWVWQAWRRWAAAAGLPEDPAPSCCPDDGQDGSA